MNQNQMSAILGFVIFVAIITLIVGVIWLSQSSLKKSDGYDIEILFESVHGLKKGDPVTVSGVKAGEVTKIDLSSGGALVTVHLKKNIFLPKDTNAYLTSSGVLGDKVINLVKGKSHEAIEGADVLIGKTIGGLDDIIEITDEIKTVLRKLTTEENTLNFGLSLERLSASLESLNEILLENKAVLDRTITNLEATSESASNILDENKEDLHLIINEIKQTSGKIDTLANNLNSTITEAHELMKRVNNGKGTLAKIINEDSLYVDVRGTVGNADSLIFDIRDLIKDIKENPTKYIDIKVKLF